MIQYYSMLIVLGICVLFFLLMMISKKREEKEKRRKFELLTIRRRMENTREQLNLIRKNLYRAENKLESSLYLYNSKKEELVQLARQLQEADKERDSIQTIIKERAPSEKELNLLKNRLKFNDDLNAELEKKTSELQEELNELQENKSEHENEINEFQSKVNEMESELEYNKELLKIKEHIN